MTNYSNLRNKFKQSFRKSKLTPNARNVGRVLADFCNNKTGLCCPSIQLMAEETGLAQSTVRRGIKELKDNSFIKVIPITPEPDPKEPEKKLYAYNSYELLTTTSTSFNKISKPVPTTGTSFDVIDDGDKPVLTTGTSFNIIDNYDKPVLTTGTSLDQNQCSPRAPNLLTPSATSISLLEESNRDYNRDAEVEVVEDVLEQYEPDIIIHRDEVMELIDGKYWLKNGDQISEEDVEWMMGGGLKVLRAIYV